MRAAEVRRLAQQARVGSGVSVLDLCCGVAGPGRMITAESGCHYLGIDHSASALATAKQLAGNLPCRFEQAHLPPLPEGRFEVVLLLETMLAPSCGPFVIRHPSHVFTYVMSPHHFVPGRPAVKSRPIRSGAGTGRSPPMVVRFQARGWRPCRPAACISRWTRLCDTRWPRAARPARIRRTPGLPRACSNTFLMTAMRAESSCDRCDGSAPRQA